MTGFEHLLWVLPAVLLVVYIGSPRFLGAMAAARTKRLLDVHFDAPEFRLCHDIDLVKSRGTVHFDHVVISRGGVHVVDSMCVSGVVKGTEVQQTWKAITPWRTRQIDNPVHANKLRIEALAEAISLPLSRFHGLVVLSGQFRFANEMPPNVIHAEKLVGRLETRFPEILTGEQMDRVERLLRDAHRQSPSRLRATKWRALQVMLIVAAVVATAWVFRAPIGDAYARVQYEVANAPARRVTVQDGGAVPATQQPDKRALNCAYSVDTDRCACRNAAGASVDIDQNECQEMAERDSVLKK